RGAAALLKKIYDQNPKPAGTTEQDIESWRYAIVKYCGIPEPDLSNRHGLNVYEFMNKGYHQFGIEWDAHPVNLAPMRAEAKAIVEEEAAKREARMKAEEALQAAGTSPPTAAPGPASPSKVAPFVPEMKAASSLSSSPAAVATVPAPTAHSGGVVKPATIIPLVAVLVIVAGY